MSGRSLKVLILFTTVFQIRGAEITCNSECLQYGNSHNITCTSLNPSNCDWYKDSSKILTCQAGGNCVPEATGFTGLRISDTHYVLQIGTVTASTIECQFGIEPPKQCSVSVVTAVGTLKAACSSDVITCSGITGHGTPAATLELKHGSTILASTTTGGSVSSTQSGSAGKTYTCAVTGTGSECLSPNSVDVTCSGPCIIILVIALVVLLLCVVVVIGVKFGKETIFLTTCVVCGSILACVGVGCTIAVFIVCTRDEPIGKAATAFSIIDIIVGIVIIVIRFLPFST